MNNLGSLHHSCGHGDMDMDKDKGGSARDLPTRRRACWRLCVKGRPERQGVWTRRSIILCLIPSLERPDAGRSELDQTSRKATHYPLCSYHHHHIGSPPCLSFVLL